MILNKPDLKFTKFEYKVIGYNEKKALNLDPAKQVVAYKNNLSKCKFKPGNWAEFKKSEILDEILYNDNTDIIKVFLVKKFEANIDQNKRKIKTKALSEIRNKFLELQNRRFNECFGSAEEEILRCIPKQLYLARKEPFCGIASAVDFCSHYPSQLCGLLPDANTAIKVSGTVKPTAEYQFAFYIKSGHLAIYNEFDTHNWLFSNIFTKDQMFRFTTFRKNFDDRFNFFVSKKDDETVLMKASKYNLKEVYEYYYAQRKVSAEAKLVLNASIGQMHRLKYNQDKYAHLAAVAIARANNKMIKLCTKLNKDQIIQIQVDGIVYTGDLKLGQEEKALGLLHQEVYNKMCRWDRIGKYMFDLGDGKFIVKHQGCNKMSDGRNVEESNSFDDMNLWINEME